MRASCAALAAAGMGEYVGAAIRGEAEPLLGRADAVGQARAIEALYRAGESGRTERLR